jgi:hypothetical protein
MNLSHVIIPLNGLEEVGGSAAKSLAFHVRKSTYKAPFQAVFGKVKGGSTTNKVSPSTPFMPPSRILLTAFSPKLFVANNWYQCTSTHKGK